MSFFLHAILLLLSLSISVDSFKISVPSTVGLDTVSLATLTWDVGDPPNVILSLLNKADGTRSIISELSLTAGNGDNGTVPLSFNATGDYVLQALKTDVVSGSDTVIGESTVIQVSQNTTDNPTDTAHSTVNTSSTVVDRLAKTSSILSSSESDSPSQVVAIISTTTVQSTIILAPTTSLQFSTLSSPTASTSVHPASIVASSPSSDKTQVTSAANPTIISTPSNGSLTNPVTVPAVIGIILGIIVALLIISILVRWYFWHSPSRKEHRQRSRQKRNAKRISPFVYNPLRPSSWGRHKDRKQNGDIEGGFDSVAFVSGPGRRQRSREILDEEDQGHGYDTKSVLERSASVISGKTCTTYTADHTESEYENRISIPTLCGDVISVASNFGSTDSQSSDKGPKLRPSIGRAMDVQVPVIESPYANEIRESDIGWLQEEMRRLILISDEREAGWALEGFQEPIPDERPPAYASCMFRTISNLGTI